MENPQQYYGSNGPMTAAGPDAVQLGALPHDLESLLRPRAERADSSRPRVLRLRRADFLSTKPGTA